MWKNEMYWNQPWVDVPVVNYSKRWQHVHRRCRSSKPSSYNTNSSQLHHCSISSQKCREHGKLWLSVKSYLSYFLTYLLSHIESIYKRSEMQTWRCGADDGCKIFLLFDAHWHQAFITCTQKWMQTACLQLCWWNCIQSEDSYNSRSIKPEKWS